MLILDSNWSGIWHDADGKKHCTRKSQKVGACWRGC